MRGPEHNCIHSAALMTQTDTILHYLSNERPEVKIVGVIALNQQLSSEQYDTEKAKELVAKALEILGSNFIKRMIDTEDQPGSNVSVRAAALNFIFLASNYREHASSFLACAPQLVASMIKQTDESAYEQCVVVLQSLCSHTKRKGREAVIEAIFARASHTSQPQQVLRLLETFTEVNTARGATDTSPTVLSAEQKSKLQRVIIQGIHGAAPQAVREGTLLCLCKLLTARVSAQSSQLALQPDWTTAGGGEAGSFPRLLCSVVRGELQLLCDEVLFLASSTNDSVAERFTLSVPPRSSAVPADEETTAASVAERAAAPAPVLPPNPDKDVDYFRTRSATEAALFCTCLRLFESFLSLLIGESVEEHRPPCWAALPLESLLQVKKALYGTIDDLLSFVKDAGGQLQEAAPAGAFLPRRSLQALSCCAVEAVTVFAVQDGELLGLIVKLVPSALSCSVMKMGKGAVQAPAVAEQRIIAAVARAGSGRRSTIAQVLSDPESCLAQPADTSRSGAETVSAEMTLELMDALRAVVEADVSDKSKNKASAETEGLLVDATTMELLCDMLPQLLPRLQYLLQQSAGYALSLLHDIAAATADGKMSVLLDLLSGAAEVAELVSLLVQCRERVHPGELQSLRCAEGDQAVQDALGISMAAYLEARTAMAELSAGVTGFSGRCAALAAEERSVLVDCEEKFDAFTHLL